MTDRLTYEQLRELAAESHSPVVCDISTELLALLARVAQLEGALCRISTACRKDTSLSPKDPILEFVVGIVDAALAQSAN